MALNLQPFRSGQVIDDPSLRSPDVGTQAAQAFLQAFLAAQRESGANARTATQERGATSRSSLQHEADMANVDLRKKEHDFKIQQEKTKQAELKARGEALKQLMPIANQMGRGQELLDAVGPQLGLTPSAHAGPQWTDRAPQAPMGPNGQPDMGAVLRGVPPEVLSSVLEDFSKVQQVRQQQTRDQITAKFQPKPDESLPAMLDRLKKMSGAFATAGDHSMVAALASDIGAIEPSRDQYEWFATKDGKTVYLPKEEGSRLRLGKPITSSGGLGLGQGGIVGAMRAISAVHGMDDADTKMRRFEIQAASGQADYNSWDYFQGQLATLYNDARKDTGLAGHLVPFFGTASGAVALAHINRTNPDLANYLQAAAQWALEDSQLQLRGGTDFKTRMDEFVSAIKPSGGGGFGMAQPKPNVQGIHDLWRSRSVRLNGYKRGLPALERQLERIANQPGISTVPENP